jgi:hypothetical protein
MPDIASLRPRRTRKARPNKPHTPATGYCFVCGDPIVGRSPRALTCETHKLPGGGKALVGCPDCGVWHIKFTNTKSNVCPTCRVDATIREVVSPDILPDVNDNHLQLVRDMNSVPLQMMLNTALEHFTQLDPHIQRSLIQGWKIRHHQAGGSHDPA